MYLSQLNQLNLTNEYQHLLATVHEKRFHFVSNANTILKSEICKGLLFLS